MGRKSDNANKNSLPLYRRQGVIIFELVLALLATLWVYDRQEAISMDLSRFEWKNRLLLIFAPDVKHPHFKRMHAEINAQSAGVKDRDLVVFEIFEKDPSQMDASPISVSDADELRKHFQVARNTYTIILVGKDGGIKLNRDDQLQLSEIFELIDSMPMRRNEMRLQNQ
jgi:hypothetical protein